jgi:ABC-type sulfate transport system permease component
MKKQAIFRIIGIGAFHTVLYLYIVPFIIYPRFGSNGLVFSIIIAIIISIITFGTMFVKNDKENDSEGRNDE